MRNLICWTFVNESYIDKKIKKILYSYSELNQQPIHGKIQILDLQALKICGNSNFIKITDLGTV